MIVEIETLLAYNMAGAINHGIHGEYRVLGRS